ncbi:MAG TPA: DUF1413 domain-containing protein [Candidatus Limiplasma sp.]|nr:DUF1413 domain-containing protein [Candidatus Limiplasma sp.]
MQQSRQSLIRPDIQALLNQAFDETDHLKKGETFLLKDLFKGYEWKRIAVKDRLLLGSLFLSGSEGSAGITAVDKTRSNWQVYQKA